MAHVHTPSVSFVDAPWHARGMFVGGDLFEAVLIFASFLAAPL